MKKSLIALALLSGMAVAHATGLGVNATAQVGIDNLRVGPVSAVVDEANLSASKSFGAYNLAAGVSVGQGQGVQEHQLSLEGSYAIPVSAIKGLTVSPLWALQYQAINVGPSTGYVGRYATDRWLLGAKADMPIGSTGLSASAELAAGRSFAPSVGSGGLYELASLGVSAHVAGGTASLGWEGTRNNLGDTGLNLDQNRIALGYTHAF